MSRSQKIFIIALFICLLPIALVYDLPPLFIDDWVDTFKPRYIDVLIDKSDLAYKIQLCHKLYKDMQRKGHTRIILPTENSHRIRAKATHDKNRNFILVLSDTQEVEKFVREVSMTNCKHVLIEKVCQS